MQVEKQKMTVFELTAAVLPFIEEKQYSTIYVSRLRYIFGQLNKYCVENGITRFTNELAQQFLSDYCNTEPGVVDKKYSHVRRAMDLLSDFQQCGTVMLRRRLNRSFPEAFETGANSYLSQMERNYAQPNTVTSHRNALYRFTDFLESRKVSSFQSISLDDINAYIKVILCNYSRDVSRLHLGILRKFFQYLFEHGMIKDDLSKKLPKMKYSSQPTHLPSAFSTEEIEKILSCVDRESPMGKRDYALLLLASRLGLRVSDIRGLTLKDINWQAHEIRITQTKTKEPLVLPLPAEVGWALIDYIKNARPVSDAPEIFLRVVAPYISLGNPDNILIRYMRLAHISPNRLRHHGLHALRHSLATHMLEQEIPILTIQSVLGHVSAEMTQRYTAVDIRQLKECALEVPEL